MSDRYDQVARRLFDALDSEATGMGVVVALAREQAPVANSLAATWPGSARVVLAGEPGDQTSRVCIATLPADGDEARAALRAINDSRQRIMAMARLVVLVVSRAQLALVQDHAADAYSTVAFVEICPFVPDTSVDHAGARRQLAAWYRQRLGKLDLRGFIRAQTEDVAWTVDEVYQELAAEPWFGRDGMPSPGEPDEAPPKPLIESLQSDFAGHRPDKAAGSAIILGHPGSGKSFFLRWLALHASAADAFLGMDMPLPILVSLAAYARAPRPMSLHDYMLDTLLEHGQAAAHVLDTAMANARVLFLLDGLDEVGDEARRRQIVAEVRELGRRAPGCLIVATSRITGYTEAPLPGTHWSIAPLADDAIERFLITWCELYARELHGPGAAERGRDEGAQLAEDILANSAIHTLAQNPLLLTVLAIVHRAGVRLPDHRVELYSHATQVLVERWNQVRSLSGTGPVAPIKTSDAVRLLGPVALDMVRTGMRGAIPEAALRRILENVLASRRLRNITSADEAIQLFQRSLGLLVEQGPGVYAFLHLTLAEYFAARELVRTDELEALVSDPGPAFLPEWREVILLAAGELGVIRADDARLEKLVDLLIDAASRRLDTPSPVVPSVLAGLLADDPGLSPRSAIALVNALIPVWWFERRYGERSLFSVIMEAFTLTPRIMRGRFATELSRRFADYYQDRASEVVRANTQQQPALLPLAWLLSQILTMVNVHHPAHDAGD